MKTKTYGVIKQYLDENMKRIISRAKVKVLSKDCIFHVALLLVYTTFFTQCFKLNIKFEAKYHI